ncbi:MAG: virulence protein RhuM/Fic/DOC family protein [Anaerolineae bacterium]|nr:virulence protein RhuM/Fic/DOC family protein [Anaerolineae bacterium]
MNTEVVVYQAADGSIELPVRLEEDTVWLNQKQMAELFGVTPENILIHLKNVYASEELEQSATAKKILVVQKEGGREVTRQVLHYALDAIISVGYRVNSKQGSRFRIWATNTLRDHLLKGYTLNQRRLAANADELKTALALVQQIASSSEITSGHGRGLIDVIARYTRTYLLLQQYDEGLLSEPRGTVGPFVLKERFALNEIARLKVDLLHRRSAGEPTEVSDLFGRERGDAFVALLGNLEQTVFGEPAYPSIEAKAAHLLYFVIKNHPFSDGNKRIASFLFVLFLDRNGCLKNAAGELKINDMGLAALALLVAESDPKAKDTVIRLVMNMLTEA